jgi:hypothetical protein
MDQLDAKRNPLTDAALVGAARVCQARESNPMSNAA